MEAKPLIKKLVQVQLSQYNADLEVLDSLPILEKFLLDPNLTTIYINFNKQVDFTNVEQCNQNRKYISSRSCLYDVDKTKTSVNQQRQL